MADTCKLKAVNGVLAHCDEEECVYWRAVGHLGVSGDGTGCAIQHFELLGDKDEVAEWLLSVKTRVENEMGGSC